MAIPSSQYFATWDVTPRTEKQVLDAKIWGIMQPKNPVLDLISKGPEIESTYFEWEYRQPDVKYVTAHASTGALTSTGTTLNLASGEVAKAKLEIGCILRDTATGKQVVAGTGASIGAGMKLGELLRVTDISGDTLTVQRDAGGFAGSGGTVPTHAAGAVYEVLYNPKQEGSDPGPDRHMALGWMSNYTVTIDFFLTITGSQAKRAMNNMAAGSQLAMQYEDRLLGAARRIESALLYGAKNPTTPGGSDTQIREMAGLFTMLCGAGGNVDYTTTVLTPAALNNLFKMILNDGGDPDDPYIIICSPDQAQVISSFGEDKVRVERTDRQYGRYITSYLSDLGFVAQVVPTVQCHRSDLAIVNTRKWVYLPYRPWFKKQPEVLQDAIVQRAITEFTCQLVDPLTAHAAMTCLA